MNYTDRQNRRSLRALNKITRKGLALAQQERFFRLEAIALGMDRNLIWNDELTAIERSNN